MSNSPIPSHKLPPPLRVCVGDKEVRFTDSFEIGRDKTCALKLSDTSVSRVHAEIQWYRNHWIVRDLNSANGTFLDGNRITEIALPPLSQLKLGEITLSIQIEEPKREASVDVAEDTSVTQVMHRYFDTAAGQMGEQTMMIRRAFDRVSKRQNKKYKMIIAIAVVFLIGAGSIAIYQHQKLGKLKQMAGEIFYTMKSVELQIAKLEDQIQETATPLQREELAKKRDQAKEMEKHYDRFLQEAGFTEKMTKETRLIYRVARIFGECDMFMPESFVQEVETYIGRWQKTESLALAIRRAQMNDFGPMISEQMLSNHLPPQFFYLALKESGFNLRSIGPKTRFGIAKGVWQFIPPTATLYGLKTGPLSEQSEYDPRDERYDMRKATGAAARYLKRIYNTEAQASGLLVMASYNWGENNIRAILRKMPEDPRERNFWNLIAKHRIPKETYEYVLYIFSAAVIGENPALFGFKFANPLV